MYEFVIRHVHREQVYNIDQTNTISNLSIISIYLCKCLFQNCLQNVALSVQMCYDCTGRVNSTFQMSQLSSMTFERKTKHVANNCATTVEGLIRSSSVGRSGLLLITPSVPPFCSSVSLPKCLFIQSGLLRKLSGHLIRLGNSVFCILA